MKFLLETGYHFGDLDYGRKADQRSIMGGRHTGHFGTGFYYVGFYDKDKTYSNYWNRGHWEIDDNKYNLYKPRTNEDAYELHTALSYLNSLTNNSFKNYNKNDLRRELDDLEYEKDNNGIIEFINKYSDWVENDPQTIKYIENEQWGGVEDRAKDLIEILSSNSDEYEEAVTRLSDIFNLSESRTEELINKAYNTKSEDSVSTLFMKALGYEGICVTHLNKDSQGLRGLDNFEYGSVIYDLKPGTYKRIK